MTLEDKKNLYRSKFPPILAERMVEQMDEEDTVGEGHSLAWMIICFKNWDHTQEGGDFWLEIYSLYNQDRTPTTEQILEVFEKHSIEHA